MGIEPTYTAWKAVILPLNYTRKYLFVVPFLVERCLFYTIIFYSSSTFYHFILNSNFRLKIKPCRRPPLCRTLKLTHYLLYSTHHISYSTHYISYSTHYISYSTHYISYFSHYLLYSMHPLLCIGGCHLDSAPEVGDYGPCGLVVDEYLVVGVSCSGDVGVDAVVVSAL